jgi:hypothetical protein
MNISHGSSTIGISRIRIVPFTKEKHNNGSTAPEQIYLVSDLGASFGTTGFVLSHEKSRGNLSAYYSHWGFIGSLTSDYVDFKAPSRSTLIKTFNPPVFIRGGDLRWIGRHIPRAAAKWIRQLLVDSRRIRYAMRSTPHGVLTTGGPGIRCNSAK